MRTIVNLNTIPAAQANATLDEIIALAQRVFTHPDARTEQAYYLGMRGEAERRMVIMYHHEDQLIGFNLIKLTRVRVHDREWSVVTSNAGFEPDHRGGNRTFPDGFRLMVRWMLREPFRRWIFVSFITSPAAYDLLVGINPSVIPSPNHPSQDDTSRALLRALATRSGYTIACDTEQAFNVWLCRASGEYRFYRDTERMAFYRRMCPNYSQGEALGVCAPITPRAVVTGFYRHWRRQRRRALSRAVAT